MKCIKGLFVLSAAAMIGMAGLIYSGLYSVAADAPHNRVTFWLLETLRERSIAQAASDIVVPDLSSSDLLLAGGPDYNDMCASCHLKPNETESDLSVGLYPAPVNLSQGTLKDLSNSERQAIARRQFWIIKHGIKASGMPAWGKTHDDERIWAMVAFLQKLPELTPIQYQILTARGQKIGHE